MEETINVIVDGWCNHADYTTQFEEFDTINLHGADSSYEVEMDTCTKCGAYRRHPQNDYDVYCIDWNGVEEMPMIPALNSGRLIQDVR